MTKGRQGGGGEEGGRRGRGGEEERRRGRREKREGRGGRKEERGEEEEGGEGRKKGGEGGGRREVGEGRCVAGGLYNYSTSSILICVKCEFIIHTYSYIIAERQSVFCTYTEYIL